MWPFGRKPIVDDDTAEWHLEHFVWLVEEHGRNGAFASTALVLPKPGFFLFDLEQGHASALQVFDQVKRYCGMTDWPVDLIAHDNPLADPIPFSAAMVAPQKHALGTFSATGNRFEISYLPSLLARPERLIAVLAHELAHYLLATSSEALPCEADEVEFLTDLTAIFLGFGVFLANMRFEFEGTHEGGSWRMEQTGYLPESDIIYALALFIRAKDLDSDIANASLKPRLAKLLRQALRQLPQSDPNIMRIKRAAGFLQTRR